MMCNEDIETIAEFVLIKSGALNNENVTPKDIIDGLIEMAVTLELPSSKAQLERYRDHYYKEEK